MHFSFSFKCQLQFQRQLYTSTNHQIVVVVENVYFILRLCKIFERIRQNRRKISLILNVFILRQSTYIQTLCTLICLYFLSTKMSVPRPPFSYTHYTVLCNLERAIILASLFGHTTLRRGSTGSHEQKVNELRVSFSLAAIFCSSVQYIVHITTIQCRVVIFVTFQLLNCDKK